jgi:hypothetical protein
LEGVQNWDTTDDKDMLKAVTGAAWKQIWRSCVFLYRKESHGKYSAETVQGLRSHVREVGPGFSAPRRANGYFRREMDSNFIFWEMNWE